MNRSHGKQTKGADQGTAPEFPIAGQQCPDQKRRSEEEVSFFSGKYR